jgi:hypothetical protein
MCECCWRWQTGIVCEAVRHNLQDVGVQDATSSDSMADHHLPSPPHEADQVACMQLWLSASITFFLSASAILHYTAGGAAVLLKYPCCTCKPSFDPVQAPLLLLQCTKHSLCGGPIRLASVDRSYARESLWNLIEAHHLCNGRVTGSSNTHGDKPHYETPDVVSCGCVST